MENWISLMSATACAARVGDDNVCFKTKDFRHTEWATDVSFSSLELKKRSFTTSRLSLVLSDM